MTVGMATTLRNSRLDAIKTAIDAGPSAGLIRIYDGTRPATGGAATTLLATLTCTDPSAGAAAAGVLTLSAITSDSSADATGTATWARIVDSTGTFVLDCSVGTSGADINFNTVSFVAGAAIAITSAVFTEGNP
jgi:hypothetical protein